MFVEIVLTEEGSLVEVIVYEVFTDICNALSKPFAQLLAYPLPCKDFNSIEIYFRVKIVPELTVFNLGQYF